MGDGKHCFSHEKETWVVYNLNDLWNISEAYSQLCQTFKIEVFAEIVNKLNLIKLNFIFAKNSILGVWQGSKYSSAFMLELFLS